MRKKLVIFLCGVLVLAVSATVVLATVFTGNSSDLKEVGSPEINAEENAGENKETESEAPQAGNLSEKAPGCSVEYTYLKGTLYKNLYETRYSNLVETMKEEPVPETEPSGGTPRPGIGQATNPGYSGEVGTYSLNSKTVAAHLSVQGTNVQNRPVWQCTGNTNYYTNGSVTWAAGSAHLRSGALSQNTVIYGHNWGNCFVPFKKTGPEFESLMAYTYADFVRQNQYIYLTTNSGTHTFRVFAVCFTKDLNFYINCNNIDVASIAARAKSMSLFDFGVNVGSGDKIITLSTCTRYFKGLGANQRFIIMGKLVSTE